MIAQEIAEDEYRIAGTGTSFGPVGEFGPLPCGCCLVAVEMDQVGPRLLYLMQRKEAERHNHELGEFADCGFTL